MEHPADNGIDFLDRERLVRLYEDDTEMLISAIETFLDEVVISFSELENLTGSQNWEGLSELTHQLRPWLGMVGLTSLETRLWEIEMLARENPNAEILMISCTDFNRNLSKMTPILQLELKELTK
ncbi:Hpt domain-containing protein [Larkinella terrae]|uniref:HPt domain-containing protein n=1 Tax=Larkinella terrae TaxID=2025311 RepID=A0A7K0EK91_9BACT|nr:Hpt domain-containing protein [Larkinella terrae]MRS62195.1 hypothetical protein [Larkinella terrae]